MSWFVTYNNTPNTHGFGRIPDPPEPPECPEFWDEEMCDGCTGYDECKAEYERRCEDD